MSWIFRGRKFCEGHYEDDLYSNRNAGSLLEWMSGASAAANKQLINSERGTGATAPFGGKERAGAVSG